MLQLTGNSGTKILKNKHENYNGSQWAYDLFLIARDIQNMIFHELSLFWDYFTVVYVENNS